MTSAGPHIASRTCTEINPSGSNVPRAAESGEESQPIERFAQECAYVLLGAPGSGKTEEFKRQAKLPNGLYISARNFLAFDIQTEWRNKTLFIDGLDEVRAGARDGRTPFDAIRNKLRQLGSPRFRLSCREADWFGSHDHRLLESVAPDGKVLVLRLDPLPEASVREILRVNFEVEDAGEFIKSAAQRGVRALLQNPLSLRLLANVVQNDWPESRSQTFEMACRTLAKELNNEHLQAIPDRSGPDDILRVAGELCAIQLLAGAAGVKAGPGGQDEGFIDLEDIAGIRRSLYLETVQTRIFDVEGMNAIPIHRQIAEYLGARYLAGLVTDGLPPGRILALMSGFDGMIVTELRGLGAWLAITAGPVREKLIERDPLGVVLYGDVAGFPKESNLRILENLKQIGKKNPWLIGAIKFDSRLADLVTPDLRDEIAACLDNPSQDFDQQSLPLFLVETLIHTDPMEGFAEQLIKIIRDDSWWLRIRKSAIKAFLQQSADHHLGLIKLKEIMGDIREGIVSDPDNDLLGVLLDATYPHVLPGTEVLDFLKEPKSHQLLSNEIFWNVKLPQVSGCEEKADLLDELATRRRQTRRNGKRPGGRPEFAAKIPLVLLESFLSNCSSEIESRRLYDWLGVAGRAGDWDQDTIYLKKQREGVRSWLEDRPELWKTLLDIGLKNSAVACSNSNESNFQQLMWMEEDRRLFGARRPLDFENWCLEKAISLEYPEAADWLMRRVADAVDEGSLSRALVDSRIEGRDALNDSLEKRLSERKQFKSWESKQRKRENKEERRELSQWRMAVRNSLNDLVDNKAPAQLLHQLAVAYFGGYHGMIGHMPVARLKILLGNDEQLVEVVLTGLKKAVIHDDLPSISEVVKWGAESKMGYLWLPFLAGYNELSRPDQKNDFSPNENQIALALAIFFNVNLWPNPWGAGDGELKPVWLRSLLKDKPKLASQILISSITAGLRNRNDMSQRLHEFAHESDYREIARLGSLRILESFPARCTIKQLPGLRYLLIAAHRHCESGSFVELIKRKLAHRSMNVAARVYWLAAGSLAGAADFLERLKCYVHGNNRRTAYLADYIGAELDGDPGQPEIAAAPILSSLILLLGSVYPPWPFRPDSNSIDEESGRVMRARDNSFGVKKLIYQLTRDPSRQASDELAGLELNDGLMAWRAQLQYSVNQQKEARREVDFQHPSLSTILGVLENRQPANPADLAALTMDHLCEIATGIRQNNTSDWRQYWNVHPSNASEQKPPTPRPEDICRDALLSDLKRILMPIGIDAEPEGRYADEKRADIRVSYRGGFNVPIEIKKSCSRDLWIAIKSQLIQKYTRDPGTGGYGIYLVFWFGNHKDCRPTSDAGPPPRSASELKRRLENGLSNAERLKISVCVIDVEYKNH